MTSRNSALLILAVLMAAVLTLGVMAGLAEPAAGFTGPAEDPEVAEPAFSPSEGASPVAGVFQGGEVTAAEAPFDLSEDRGSSGGAPTHGIIRGEVALSSTVAPDVKRVTIRLQENRNWNGSGEPPFAITQGVNVDRSTPSFEFTQVPFSEHGYSVEAFAPGTNGSAAPAPLTPDDPSIYVRLSLTEPVPFSVMLRDQFQNPVTDVQVRLFPQGKPLGRPAKHGEVDNYGIARFDGVLAGAYKVEVGQPGSLLVDPLDVTIQRPGVTVLDSRAVAHQHKVIEIPVGVPLTVTATELNGWAIEEVKVEVLQINTRQLLERTAKTERTGEAKFPHMPRGDYRISIHKQGYQRITRTLNIAEEAMDAVLRVQLSPLR